MFAAYQTDVPRLFYLSPMSKSPKITIKFPKLCARPPNFGKRPKISFPPPILEVAQLHHQGIGIDAPD